MLFLQKLLLMKKLLTLILSLVSPAILKAQTIRPFLSDASARHQVHDQRISRYHLFTFSPSVFTNGESFIPFIERTTAIRKHHALIELPMADGAIKEFRIAEIAVLSKESAALYPEIKTYHLLSSDESIVGRLTKSSLGIHAMLLTPQGKQYIVPAMPGDAVAHLAYFREDYNTGTDEIRCGVEELEQTVKELKLKTTTQLGDCMLRTYNLAIAATGEFTTSLGGQSNAVASITATIANVNLIYERDLGIHFNLIVNNSIVFTNAATDPYPTVSFPTQALLDANTNTLNTQLGSSAYDVGMVFSDGWNGGLAYNPGVCNATIKGGSAAGVTGAPYGPVMENVVAHEIGHLFAADHTMSAGTGPGCTSNLNLPTAYEIGGGSTIMGYAGAVCAGMFYQNNTDDYFHYNSVSIIRLYAQALTTCGITTGTSNSAPTLTVPATSYTIPVSTPFELTANATDANAATSLTYTFEQYDAATAAMTAPPSSTAVSGPLFRSYPPSASNTRTFPSLTNILNNTTNAWEVLPSITRTMNFRLLVRDNHSGDGCVAQESIVVNTNSTAGPFAITSQNSAVSYTANGTNTMTVTWNVASTTSAPVSTPNVDIYFSVDNGQTFPHLLASGVSNNGSASVVVPNVNTTQGRIKVKGANNIFFDINNAPITITSSCTANGSTIAPATPVTAQQGNASLNLGLSPNFGSPMTVSGTLTATDPVGSLAAVNISGSACINFSGNPFQYDLYTFQVNVSGSYTFTTSGATPFGTVINLYTNSFSPTAPCNNFVTSNAVYNGTSAAIGTSITATLDPGITYVLAVGTFSGALPTLPAAYTVNVTTPTGGDIFNGTPNPGATFSYKYAIVNIATGNIVAITNTPDLTSYAASPYVVYGLSVSNSVSQTTLNTYVGGSFTAFQTALLNSTLCGNLSGNSVSVTITSPLRLEDLKLNARADGAAVLLNWTANGEESVYKYVVEKKLSENEFVSLEYLRDIGKGQYNFRDQNPVEGHNIYRIKALEKDGGVLYSNLASAYFSQGTIGQMFVMPNPVSDMAIIRLPASDNYEVVLMDIRGRVLYRSQVSAGEFSLDMSSFAPGSYILSCSSTSGRTFGKIIKE